MRAALLMMLMLAASALSGCAGDDPPQKLAEHVDLQRYAQRWYIIANIPYFAENGKVGSWFDITMTAPDRFDDVYWGRPGSLDAPAESFTMRGYVKEGTNNAYWRETPLWPLYLSYLILYVDPDYRTALVGYPGHSYGWVLSHTPTMDEPTYQALLARFAAQGYDTSKFVRIPQRPE